MSNRYKLYETRSPIDPSSWRELNQNWELIQSYLRFLERQIKFLAGGKEIDEILNRIDTAIENAENATGDAEAAKREVDNALRQLEALVTSTQNAANNANTAANNANELNTALTALKRELETLQTNLNTIVQSEAQRVAAENTRRENEAARSLKEQARESAEQQRNTTFDSKMTEAEQKTATMQNLISKLVSYNYSPGATYDFPNLIKYNGSTFIALRRITGITPVDDGVNYRLVAEKGAKGDTGAGINVLGKLNNISELPTGGKTGDAYLIGINLYIWGGAGWVDGGPIQGPKGDNATSTTFLDFVVNASDATQVSLSDAATISLTGYNYDASADSFEVYRNSRILYPNLDYNIENGTITILQPITEPDKTTFYIRVTRVVSDINPEASSSTVINALGYTPAKSTNLAEVEQRLTTQLAQNALYSIDEIHHLIPTSLKVTESEATGIRLRHMSVDGIVYGIKGSVIKKYNDLSNTWTDVLTAPLNPNFLLALDNGELLFGTNDTNNPTSKAKLYVTRGNQTTFSQVLEASHDGNVYFGDSWSKSTYGNIVVVGEYGDNGRAVKAYLSEDYGATFKEIFDVRNYSPTPTGDHLHGVAYDPYWRRIWIVTGDASNYMFWSDDMGATWSQTETQVNQLLNIMPMQNCVLFGSDYAGIYAIFRYDRVNKKDVPKLKIAHEFAEPTTELNHMSYLPKEMYRRDENSPVIINIVPENPSLAGKTYKDVWALVTYDGYNFNEIYRNQVGSINDISLKTYFPTKNNKAVVTTADGKVFVGESIKWKKNDTSYKTPYLALEESLDDIYVNVKDFGVRNYNEHVNNFANNLAFGQALAYAADHHKILYVPKDVEVNIADITIENKSNFGLKVDGKLKIKPNRGLKGLAFKNCSNIRIFDVNAVYETYSDPHPDLRNVLMFESCSNIYFDNIIAENVFAEVVSFVRCSNVFGKLIKATGNGTGSDTLTIEDSTDVYIDELIIDGVGSDNLTGGLRILTSSSTAVIKNINFKNIYIRNKTAQSLILNNAAGGTFEDLNLGTVKLIKQTNTIATSYGLYMQKCKNITGNIAVESLTPGLVGVHTTDVDRLSIRLHAANLRIGLQQVGLLSNSKIAGNVSNASYRAITLSNLTDVNFNELEVGAVTDTSQPSVTFSSSGVYTNVLFDKCKFKNGGNSHAVDVFGTTTNVEFRNCDLSEWTVLNNTIRCGATSPIKRVNNLGVNYQSAIPTTLRWNIGEIIHNTAPQAGGYVGWICTTGGAYPAFVFKGFGLIQA